MAVRFGRRESRHMRQIREFVRRYRVQCLIAVIVIVVVAIVWVTASQAANRQNYEESFIVQDDTIRIGIRVNAPGYGEISEDGQIIGYDRDYIDEVLRRMISEPKIYEYVPLTSQDAGAEIKYGGAQICLGQLSEGRIQTSGFSLTVPYCADSVVAVVSDTSRLENLADLESGIGILATAISVSDAQDHLAEQGVTIPLTSYSDYESALTDLSHSRINAVLMPYSTARLLQQSGYRIIAEPIFDIRYCIMLPSGADAVTEEMNRVIREMAEDGTTAALRAKWNV